MANFLNLALAITSSFVSFALIGAASKFIFEIIFGYIIILFSISSSPSNVLRIDSTINLLQFLVAISFAILIFKKTRKPKSKK